MEIEPAKADDFSLGEYAALFATCFPAAAKLRRVDYLRWLYAENPGGMMVGFNARDDSRVVAHYACIPMSLLMRGERVSAMLSLNTATHPEYQGRGLFTKLAEATYAAGASIGIQAVYGVANANSTPGFLRKLGFVLTASLDARIGLGRLHARDWGALARAPTRVDWSAERLRWRGRNPANPLAMHPSGDGSIGWSAATSVSGLRAWAQLPAVPGLTTAARRVIPSARLWVGCVPRAAVRMPGFVRLPGRFRSSPLNLIVRGLDETRVVHPDEAFFSFLDFDAF